MTSRQIRDRLTRELEKNVALRVEPGETMDEFSVSGRGLLHLGVLIETMRREGYELAIGKPEVVTKIVDGVGHEPIERLVIDAPTDFVGPVMELVGGRRGELQHMEPRGTDFTHMVFEITARGLIGLRSRVLTATQGNAIMHHNFNRYEPSIGDLPKRGAGVIVTTVGSADSPCSGASQGASRRVISDSRPQLCRTIPLTQKRWPMNRSPAAPAEKLEIRSGGGV